MAKYDEGELMEVRCKTCGMFLGFRRRLGGFVFWCSEECADTPMAKFDVDQIRDEVAVELYLAGWGIMEVSRFTDTPYTRIQQLLYRRNITLTRSA
jgi:hypothetical protein